MNSTTTPSALNAQTSRQRTMQQFGTAPTRPGPAHSWYPDQDLPASRGRIGRVVAGSSAAGLVAALFIRPDENDVTGAVL